MIPIRCHISFAYLTRAEIIAAIKYEENIRIKSAVMDSGALADAIDGRLPWLVIADIADKCGEKGVALLYRRASRAYDRAVD